MKSKYNKDSKDICKSCRKCLPIPKNISQCREYENIKVWKNRYGK